MQKVDVTGVSETMLQTLYVRARCSQQADAKFVDEKACQMAEQIDYDFSVAQKDATMSKGVLERAIMLDRLVGEWLGSHPGATVVILASGLDARAHCVQGWGRWYNLDLDQVIELRRRLCRGFVPRCELPCRARHARAARVVCAH